jgi:hypothetical protein
MIKNSGWGTREIESLKAASIPLYVETLGELGPGDLGTFLQRHLSWLVPGTGYAGQDGFAQALPCFLEACRQVTGSHAESRLKKIILSSFENAKLTHLLVVENESKAQQGAAISGT